MKRPKHKERRRRRKRSWYLIWFLIMAFFGASLLFLIGTLPIWQIESFRVKGLRILTLDEVKKHVKIPVGENIFLADISETRALLSDLPMVKEVRISRSLPSTLVVNITERKEIAVLLLKEDSMLIDEEGYIINPPERRDLLLELPDTTELPIIEGLAPDWVSPRHKLKNSLGLDIASLLFELKELIAPKRIKVNLSNKEGVMLLLDDYLKVKMGDPKKMKEKIGTLKAILSDIKDARSNLEYIDVRFPQFPAVKLFK